MSFNPYTVLAPSQHVVYCLHLTDNALGEQLGIKDGQLLSRRLKVLGIIHQTLLLPTLTTFSHVTKPQDLLDYLKVKYQPNNQAHLFQLFVQLKSKLQSREGIDSYLYHMYKINNKLQLHPQWRLPPGVMASCILKGLPVEYNEAKQQLKNTLNQYNISTIMNYLSTKELSLG